MNWKTIIPSVVGLSISSINCSAIPNRMVEQSKEETQYEKPVDTNNQEIQKGKLNVLFIMVDDFNHWANCVGYYPHAITPNIDKLAKKGMLFANTFCASPVSNPSRNALWSGYRPSTTGIQSNSGGYIRDIPGFDNIVTMNQFFKNKGYHVYGTGKLYHPGHMGSHHTDPDNWSETNKTPTGANATGGIVELWTNPGWPTMKYKIGKDDTNNENSADFNMANQVAEYLEAYQESEQANQPFFIGCGFFRPHLPWNISNQFFAPYNQIDLSIPEGYSDDDLEDIDQNSSEKSHQGVVDANQWKKSIQAYLACMSHADHCVGIVLDALENTPYKDNTVIVFVGDHGWHLGEKKAWGKNTVYNPANRTTFILHNPQSNLSENNRCEIPVSMQDIYPTLVNVCNLGSTERIEGNNIIPLLENPNDPNWNIPVMGSYNGTHYVQDRNYKLISRNSKSQLYHIASDPNEFVNLYDPNNPKVMKIVNAYEHKIDSIIAIGNSHRKNLGLEPVAR